MQVKWLFRIGIAVAALASFYFIIKLNMTFAVIAMTALFAMTNGSRAKSFKGQGMARESKWMLWLSMFFTVACLVLLLVILFT